jgi:hypothetical protein
MAWEKSIFLADTHGDLVCPEAVKVVKRFMDDWQPKIRVHLGDAWDFRSLRKGASPEERMEGISYDYSCGMELLDWYRPNMLTMGNHDARLWRAAEESSNGILADLCTLKAQDTEDELRKRKIKWVPWKVTDRFKIGNLNRTERTAQAFMQQLGQALALMAQALRPQPAPLLLSICVNCGAAAVQPGSKFCPQCGAAQQ